MISDITPVNNYTGNGSTTSFDFDFYIENESQLKVYLINSDEDLILLTKDVDYSVNEFTVDSSRPTPDYSEGGYIIYPITGSSHTTLSTNEKISLQLDIPFSQESEYQNSSLLNLSNLEFSFDYLTRLTQILKRQVDRCAKLKEGSTVNPETLSQNINKLADISGDITTVATSISDVIIASDNTENISTVAGSISDVNTVAGSIDNIDSVAGSLSNITAVKNDLSNIDSVAGSLSNINAVRDDLNNIDSVAGSLSNINSVASDLIKINSVADDLIKIDSVADDLSNIDSVAGSLSNINAVNSNKANIDTVAGSIDNINSVAGSLSNINAVKNDLSNIDSVAGGLSNINSVADDLINITAVKNDLSNIDSVAGGLSNIDSVAGSLSNINSVASDLSNINAVKNDLSNIDSVAGSLSDIDSVAGSLSNINSVANDLTNIDLIAGDLTNINNASNYANNANIWAEGTDEQVEALGGVHSSKRWAEVSASGQIQADWSQSDNTKKDYIKNKPNLASVATSGSYTDLSNRPTIPDAQIQSDWTQNDTTKKDYIKNKPYLASVATSGSYNDLSNKPTIPTVPTALSAFTDDLGTSPIHTHSQYLTSHQDISNLANKDLSNLTATGEAHFQVPLVSGTNIKTINNTSLLGSGDISIQSAIPISYEV